MSIVPLGGFAILLLVAVLRAFRHINKLDREAKKTRDLLDLIENHVDNLRASVPDAAPLIVSEKPAEDSDQVDQVIVPTAKPPAQPASPLPRAQARFIVRRSQ